MPALFSGGGSGDTFTPLAQLGAGPDGTVVLARRGERLVETHQLTFGAGTPRWAKLEARVRSIGVIEHPAMRPVIALEPPSVILEGDSFPPLAELIEQPTTDLPRAVRILLELGRALAVAHHASVAHGNVHPWSVWIGTKDRKSTRLNSSHSQISYAVFCLKKKKKKQQKARPNPT